MFCLNHYLFIIFEKSDMLVWFLEMSILVLKVIGELFDLICHFSDGFVQLTNLILQILILVI